MRPLRLSALLIMASITYAAKHAASSLLWQYTTGADLPHTIVKSPSRSYLYVAQKNGAYPYCYHYTASRP